MAKKLTGDVDLKRIWELLEKILVSGDLPNYNVAIDKQGEDKTLRVPLDKLLAFASLSTTFLDSIFKIISNIDSDELSFLLDDITGDVVLTVPDKSIVIGEGIHKPSTQPAIVISAPNTLTLDCNNAEQASFEPRLSVGTLTINIDFDYILTNAGDALIIDQTIQLTGTRIISFPSTGAYEFLVSNPSSLGTWDDVLKELTITAGTDDIIEISMKKYNSPTLSVWLVKISEIAI